jgi:hypothetical protein
LSSIRLMDEFFSRGNYKSNKKVNILLETLNKQ